uniref:Uncharacterized protein n=1 Tax=Arundo donax TaxID=35708 RepID=A0A0A9CTS6_ARUDO
MMQYQTLRNLTFRDNMVHFVSFLWRIHWGFWLDRIIVVDTSIAMHELCNSYDIM